MIQSLFSKRALVSLLWLCTGVFIHAESSFFAAVSYPPGISDYMWIGSEPYNHTLQRYLLAVNLDLLYTGNSNFGMAADLYWGKLDQLKIMSSKNVVPIDVTSNDFLTLHFSPQGSYSFWDEGNHHLSLGLGPSLTFNYEPLRTIMDFNDLYIGISSHLRYNYAFYKKIFLRGGLRLGMDFIYLGEYTNMVFNGFLQTQLYPEIGIGIRF